MDAAPDEPRVEDVASPAGPPHQRGWKARQADLYSFVRILARRLKDDAWLQQAGALAYNTLFSMLPTLVLALLVLSIMSAPSAAPVAAPRAATAESRPTNGSAGLAPDTLPITAPATAPASAPSGRGPEPSLAERAQDWLLTQLGLRGLTIENPQSPRRSISVERFLAQRITKVRELVQSPGTGLIAFGALLYGVISLMMVIEHTFNAIYRAPQSRRWPNRFALYTALFFWGPLSVGTSLVLSQRLLVAVQPGEWLKAPISILGSYGVSWILLVLFYKIIPNVLVRWRSAFLGAAVGAFLWELGKYGFGQYVHFSVGTRSWYGNVALVPLFMFWIYLTWNFVLLGLQVAYVHQYFAALRRQLRLSEVCDFPIADLRWVLPLGVLLYRRFARGEALPASQAAEEIGIPPDIADHLLGALCRAELVHRISEDAGYVLARPAEKITAEDLLRAARELCTPVLDTQAAGVNNAPGLRHLEQLEHEWLRAQTLPMLSGAA